MGPVLLHNLQDHLQSMRFQLIFAVLLLFFAANGIVYTWKMDRGVVETAQIEASNRSRMEASTLRQAVDNSYDFLLPASGTEFMAEGGLNWLKDTARINPATGRIPLVRTSVTVTNAWMERFEVLDWTFIIRVVLSFMAIAMAYNSVSGEIESGTLRLALANPLSRARFAVAKLGSYLIVLTAAVVVGSLVSLVVLSTYGHLTLTWALARSYALFLAATLLYLILFLCVAFAASALTGDSASSLVLLVVCWVMLTVIVPQASYLIGITAVDAPGYGGPTGAYARLQALSQSTLRGLELAGIGLRGRDLGQVDGFALERQYAARMNQADAERAAILRHADQELLAQFEVAKAINLISPGYAYTYSVEAVIGVGVARLEHFYEQAWHYRRGLLDFLRARDAVDLASPHITFLPDYMSDAPLDAQDLPRLRATPIPLSKSMRAGVVALLILLLEALCSFLFALWSINRSELG